MILEMQTHTTGRLAGGWATPTNLESNYDWTTHPKPPTSYRQVTHLSNSLYPMLFPWHGWIFSHSPHMKSHWPTRFSWGNDPETMAVPSQRLKRSDLAALLAPGGASWTRRDRALSSGASMDTVGGHRCLMFDDVLWWNLELEWCV